jgi:hypothetical protein
MAKAIAQVRMAGWTQAQAGLKELEATFGKAAGREAVRKGLTEAARPIQATARGRAPDAKVGRSIRITQVYARSLVATGKGKMGKHGNRYRKSWVAAVNIRPHDPKAHWFELGTKARWTKNNAFRGRMTARPYMAPAWEAHKDQVAARVVPAVQAHIRALTRKYTIRTAARVNAGGSL